MSGHFNVTSAASTLVQEDIFSGECVSFQAVKMIRVPAGKTMKERRKEKRKRVKEEEKAFSDI